MGLRNLALRLAVLGVLAAVPATAFAANSGGPVPVKSGSWQGTSSKRGHTIFSASFKVSDKQVTGFKGSFSKYAPSVCRLSDGKFTLKAKSLKLSQHKGTTKSGIKYDYWGYGTQNAAGGLNPKQVTIERNGKSMNVLLALQFTKIKPEGELGWGSGKDLCEGFFNLKHT
jgi:hypothetical protein